jgi:hypothetical protein
MQSSPTVIPTSNSTQKFFISAVNGTVIYMLAYLLVNGLHQVATMLMASRLQVRGAWDMSKISYSIANSEWWRTAVIAVYGVGPLVVAVAGLIAYQWYWRQQRAHRGLFKLLLLWMAIHACNAVLGSLVADTILQTGFWYVPSWLFQLGNVVNILLAILAALAQVAVGYFLAAAFLQAHDSRTVMQYANRRRMVASTIFLPWVAGSLLLAVTKAPVFSLIEGLHYTVLLLLLIPMSTGCLNELFGSTVRSPQKTRVAWGLLSLLVLLLLVWRLLLSPPMLFGV